MIKRQFRTREETDRQIEPRGVKISVLEFKVRIYKRRFRKATTALTQALKRLNKLRGLLEIERLAELEHDQWVYWTQQIADKVPEQLREKWEKLWIPYSELPEKVKEQDRVWARKILEGVEE